MEKLIDILESFNGRNARNEKDLIDKFRNIADVVINGGYFLINGTAKIFVTDVEFYFHSERNEQELWKKTSVCIIEGQKRKCHISP